MPDLIPPDHFETERLRVRMLRLADVPAIYAAIQESLDTLRQWMMWASGVQTLVTVEANTRDAITLFKKRDTFRFGLFRKSDNYFVGMTEIHSFDWSVPRCELGYWVRTSLQGQGLTEYSFHEFKALRVEIRCNARNLRSAAVAERAAYALEARLHHNERDVGGELRDTLIYAHFPAQKK